MKQGTNNHLKVVFDGIDPTQIQAVEFVFAQTKDGPIIKSDLYRLPGAPGAPGDVNLTDGAFLVPFLREETYLFRPGTTFYMDTRVRMPGSLAGDNPPTPIVAIQMEPTLFGAIDSAEETT